MTRWSYDDDVSLRLTDIRQDASLTMIPADGLKDVETEPRSGISVSPTPCLTFTCIIIPKEDRYLHITIVCTVHACKNIT